MVSIGEFHMAKSPHSSQRPSPNLENHPTLGTLDDPCWPPPKPSVGAWKTGGVAHGKAAIFLYESKTHAIAGIYGCSSRSSPQKCYTNRFSYIPIWYIVISLHITGYPWRAPPKSTVRGSVSQWTPMRKWSRRASESFSSWPFLGWEGGDTWL